MPTESPNVVNIKTNIMAFDQNGQNGLLEWLIHLICKITEIKISTTYKIKLNYNPNKYMNMFLTLSSLTISINILLFKLLTF